MNILFIDSATEACTAAVWQNGAVLSAFELAPRAHTHRLLPMAEELLNEAGISYSQLDLVAFGRGPGSFTGVRIATACAQGIALGVDIPIVGISSLATLAQALRAQAAESGGIIHAAIDARMGEVYYGQFETARNVANKHQTSKNQINEHQTSKNQSNEHQAGETHIVRLIGKEQVISPDILRPDILATPSAHQSEWATGSGFARYPTLLATKAWQGSTPDAYPDARFGIELAAATPPAQWQDPTDAAPIYLRDNVAQVKKTTEEKETRAQSSSPTRNP